MLRMKAEFSREAYHSYMILEPENITKDCFEERMLVNQKSEYLLRFHPQETDGVRKYYYEITGMMDFVSCVNRRPVSCRVLKGMIRSVLGVCEAVNEYLLDPEGLLLLPDKIYMDAEAEGMHFAYLPGYKSDFLQGLQELSECMLSAADHTDRECVMLVYEFYRIVRESDFSAASGVNDCLAAALAYRFGWLRGAAASLEIEEKYILAGILFLSGAALFAVMKLSRHRKETIERAEDPYCLQPEEDFWKKADFPGGHYEYLDDSEDDSDHTVVLTAGKGVRLSSMNKAIAADLAVCEFPSILGAKAPEAQTVLPCQGISRKHALLEQEAGRYYISDLASTNGTWLNGERLVPNEKKVLVNEDLITFADVRFMFFSAGFSPDDKG